jgi:hypothetical protein
MVMAGIPSKDRGVIVGSMGDGDKHFLVITDLDRHKT